MLFFAIGAGTFILRFSFIYLFGKVDIPGWLKRALRYVPVSVLAALVLPALTSPTGSLDISLSNVRLLAGLAGALVAWNTRDVLWTITVGMVVFWLLQAFMQ
jgi:branched-subunit amino acid transport protein